eukprot:m.47405 g.47405  ORF g.47405 m.47405 type:complete len:76 (+) comp10977_c1_seq1:203-430(+)
MHSLIDTHAQPTEELPMLRLTPRGVLMTVVLVRACLTCCTVVDASIPVFVLSRCVSGEWERFGTWRNAEAAPQTM